MASRTSITTGQLEARKRIYVTQKAAGKSDRSSATAAGYAAPSVSAHQLNKSTEIQQALAYEREQYRLAAQVTREEVVAGIKDAIEQSKMIADPATTIRGWSELGKMLGFYEPERKVLQISLTAEKKRQQLELLSDDELLELTQSTGMTIEGESTPVADDGVART